MGLVAALGWQCMYFVWGVTQPSGGLAQVPDVAWNDKSYCERPCFGVQSWVCGTGHAICVNESPIVGAQA
eukprot:9889097-Alexandrium_andersonii.AAC.1